MTTAEEVLTTAAISIGPDVFTELVRAVVKAGGSNGPERVRAILNAEYASNDGAVNIYEDEKLAREAK